MTSRNVNILILFIFWRARVFWPMSPIFFIFERFLDSNPESCPSKQARYHLMSNLQKNVKFCESFYKLSEIPCYKLLFMLSWISVLILRSWLCWTNPVFAWPGRFCSLFQILFFFTPCKQETEMKSHQFIVNFIFLRLPIWGTLFSDSFPPIKERI